MEITFRFKSYFEKLKWWILQDQKKDIDETIQSLTLNSMHAFEKEIQSGYITIEGGHRVGLGGDCVYAKNEFKSF